MKRFLPQDSRVNLIQKSNSLSPVVLRPERYLEILRSDSLTQLQERGISNRLQSLKQGFDQNRPALDKARQAVKFDENALRADTERLQAIRDPAALQAATAQFLQRWSSTIESLRSATGLTGNEAAGGAAFAGMRLKNGVLQGDSSSVEGSSSQVTYKPLSAPGRTSGIGKVLKILGDKPKPAGPQQLSFKAPFTGAGVSGGDGDKRAATAADGKLSAFSILVWVGSEQIRSFITQSLAVPAGVSRVSVAANLSAVSWWQGVVIVLGYGNTESIVNLRVMDGSRVVASDRISLKRISIPVAGGSSESGSGPVSLRCEFNRDRPGDISNYTLIAEVENWAGLGSILGTIASCSTIATVGSFDAVLYS
ncbi:MAG: hypothetical protein NTX57_14575 [Armatimonadetes bacterium]|nr:hypothetical protein [Armatimonadota bacterium]